jgi:ssDNA-specific exonuclease RecJ
MSRKIVAVITAITGDRVVIGEAEFNHAIKDHFQVLPSDMLLELIERVLKNPTKIFEEKKLHQYYLFYRIDHRRYLVAVIKRSESGNYFSTIYSTGTKIRNKHKKLKEIKP